MSDLSIGIVVVAIVSAALMALGFRLQRTVSKRTRWTLAVTTVVLLFIYAKWFSDNLLLARVLPFSNLVVVGNVTLPLAAFLAGLSWGLFPAGTPRWRRLLVAVVLPGLAFVYGYAWLFLKPEGGYTAWRDGVMVQTNVASCSAASAGTLLKCHDINSTHDEMTRLCLTRSWGTSRWGVYRGLKLMTTGTPYRVELFTGNLESLSALQGEPVLLLVCLKRGADVDPRYEKDWQWTPGVWHAVVFFRFAGDDMVEMGDPSVGREYWTVQNLRDLWHGTALRLVRN